MVQFRSLKTFFLGRTLRNNRTQNRKAKKKRMGLKRHDGGLLGSRRVGPPVAHSKQLWGIQFASKTFLYQPTLVSMELVMSDRTKLTIISVVVIMLPYRLDFPIALLVITAEVSTAIDIVIESWAQRQYFARNFIFAISLYRRLKYHPL
jgi:hypothetical protein